MVQKKTNIRAKFHLQISAAEKKTTYECYTILKSWNGLRHGYQSRNCHLCRL